MKTLRLRLGILAIIPLALLADKLFFHPTEYDEDSIRTMAYLASGNKIIP